MSMTKKGRREWVRELSKEAVARLLKGVDTMPTSFDGREIREFMVRDYAKFMVGNRTKITSSLPANLQEEFDARYARYKVMMDP